jgi:uncharacterized protein YjbI with pentapeptide repeats
MSGDTPSSDMTWACSVDKLDKTAEDGAVNDRAASALVGRDLAGRDLAGFDLAGRDLAGRDLTSRDLTSLDLAGRDLDSRTQFVVGTFRSALMKSGTVLGGAGTLRGRRFERVVRSGEHCSPHGGSTPR